MLISEQIKQTLSDFSQKNYQITIQNPSIEIYKGENYGHYST